MLCGGVCDTPENPNRMSSDEWWKRHEALSLTTVNYPAKFGSSTLNNSQSQTMLKDFAVN